MNTCKRSPLASSYSDHFERFGPILVKTLGKGVQWAGVSRWQYYGNTGRISRGRLATIKHGNRFRAAQLQNVAQHVLGRQSRFLLARYPSFLRTVWNRRETKLRSVRGWIDLIGSCLSYSVTTLTTFIGCNEVERMRDLKSRNRPQREGFSCFQAGISVVKKV